MHPLKLAISCAWLVFWIYWLASAASSKESVESGWRSRLTGVSAIAVFLVAGVLRGGSLAVHSVILETIGAVLFVCGTALVNNLLGLIVVVVVLAYFYYCGTVEERNLAATFPQAYPEYKSRTKMLIPFLL